MLNNKQYIEFARCNCINEAACPLKSKCHYKSIVYKLRYIAADPLIVVVIMIILMIKTYTWALRKERSKKRYYNKRKNVAYEIRGAYDTFPDFFRMGTFIDSSYMKL